MQRACFSAVAWVSGAPRGSHSRCEGDGAKSRMMANKSQLHLLARPLQGRGLAAAAVKFYLKYLTLYKRAAKSFPTVP